MLANIVIHCKEAKVQKNWNREKKCLTWCIGNNSLRGNRNGKSDRFIEKILNNIPVSYNSCEVELTIAHAGGQQSGGELRFEKQK